MFSPCYNHKMDCRTELIRSIAEAEKKNLLHD
jgi:hypothetical protein